MIASDKVLVVDIDGTLCPIKPTSDSYADLPVNEPLRDRLNNLHAQGWRIVLASARGMRTFDGNTGEIAKNVLPMLLDWLERHDVHFDEINMAKPWPGHNGFYIDDRTVRPREFLTHTLEELDAICARDRCL
ncbi:MAG: capsular biosynthesis protein [Novosphingobium sp.]